MNFPRQSPERHICSSPPLHHCCTVDDALCCSLRVQVHLITFASQAAVVLAYARITITSHDHDLPPRLLFPAGVMARTMMLSRAREERIGPHCFAPAPPPLLAAGSVLRAAGSSQQPFARRFLHDDRDGHDTNGREAQHAAPSPVEEVRPSAVEAQHWGDYRVDQFAGEQPRRGPQRSQRRAPQRGLPTLSACHAQAAWWRVRCRLLLLMEPSVLALHAADEMQEAASVGYQYLDPQGVVRGPFPAAKFSADASARTGCCSR